MKCLVKIVATQFVWQLQSITSVTIWDRTLEFCCDLEI